MKFELKEIKLKPTICVDIDGTIIDPYFFIPYLNKLNGVNIDKKNYTSIKWTDTYGDRFGSLYRNFDTIFTYVYEEAKLLPNVLETIEMLEHRGFNVYFVTARDTKIDSITKKWIEKNGMNPDRVISLGTKNKINIAKKLGCDVFIEDDPGNIEQLLSAGFEVIALDTNYNRAITGERLTRVSNWAEIMGIFESKEL
ncbi:MAG: HAD family acid phosphatase [Peptostreptococcus porci]|nr:HAD family acid phosphatase [Peptostreptococcus porci]MDD7183378.1 HAD family acid phosphatase [Peptostreptococcus porci]